MVGRFTRVLYNSQKTNLKYFRIAKGSLLFYARIIESFLKTTRKRVSGNNENNTCTVPTSKSQNQLSSSGRPYAATLPRKGAGGN